MSELKQSFQRPIVFALLFFQVGLANAVIVYDNTTTSQGGFTPASLNESEIGDEVTLAGGANTITSIMLAFFYNIANSTSSADVQIRFYENDGTAGVPSTLFWDSGIIDNLMFSSGENYFTFAVDNVVAPPAFTWTVQMTDYNQSIGSIGPMLFDPPTVGSSDNYVWFDHPTNGWEKVNIFNPSGPDPISNFYAKITAAPEPATLALICLGLAGVGFRRYRAT